MKTRNRLILLTALTLVFVLLLGSSALAGWQSDSTGWWYSYADGSYAQSRWLLDGNGWYYFGSDGYMVTGWQEISGTRYCFDKNGKMATGWTSVDGSWYHFDQNGHADSGWLLYGGNWYCLDSSGKMMTGWVQSGGAWYFMKSDGSMAKGWQKFDGDWYYLDNTGAMVTGWKEIDGAWYYFNSDGRMFSNAYIDQKYFIGENGQWDSVTITEIPELPPAEPEVTTEANTLVLTFNQDAWYVARLEVQIWDKTAEQFSWVYSDSACKGQRTTVKIDTEKYEVSRVGFQVWYFGWDNFYFNLPWASTDNAKTFTLTGYGDYPEFTWE